MASAFSIEGAKIVFRNFSGLPSRFNKEGDRNFCLLLSKETANALKEDGPWNVKQLRPKEEDDDPQDYIQVAVNYNNTRHQPRVVLVNSVGKTMLTEDTVSLLDYADIRNVDVVVNPREWEDSAGNKRIKAYLKAIYVTVDEDEFEKKYSDLSTNE